MCACHRPPTPLTVPRCVCVCVCRDAAVYGVFLYAAVGVSLWVTVIQWCEVCSRPFSSKALSGGPYISTTIYTSVLRQGPENSENNESLSHRHGVCVWVWERGITRGRRDSVNKRQKRFIKTPPPLTILLSFHSPCPSPPPPYLHFSQPEKRLHAPVSLVFHLSLWRGEEWRSSAACNYTERSWMRASVATKKSNSHPSHHPKYLLIGGDTGEKKGI